MASVTATAQSDFVFGLRDSVPIVWGYVPACLTFGIVGTGLGVDPLAVFLLSALLYAGASQFVAVKLMASSSAVPVMLLTVALVNIRYVVLARALGRRLHGPRRSLVAAGAFLTEEVYAIAQYGRRTQARDQVSTAYLAGIELPPYTATLVCTALGIVAGNAVPVELLPSLNTSLYALLIALVAPQALANRRVAVMCLIAAGLSIVVSNVAGESGAVLVSLAAGAMYLRATRPRADPAPLPTRSGVSDV